MVKVNISTNYVSVLKWNPTFAEWGKTGLTQNEKKSDLAVYEGSKKFLLTIFDLHNFFMHICLLVVDGRFRTHDRGHIPVS